MSTQPPVRSKWRLLHKAGIFSTIVQVPGHAPFHIGQKNALCDAIALLLHQDVQHAPVLIYRAPEVVSHAIQADETSSGFHVSPGCGRRQRNRLVNLH
jgi:hypothetical protein